MDEDVLPKPRTDTNNDSEGEDKKAEEDDEDGTIIIHIELRSSTS